MVELLIGAILGGILSWVITHIYYKKSSKEIPDWAKPIIKKLPQSKPTRAKLLKLFQDALNTGDIIADPMLGHVACPKCKAPASDFEEQLFEDEHHTVVSKTCPHCGWSKDVEL
jgi:hypothetical protein